VWNNEKTRRSKTARQAARSIGKDTAIARPDIYNVEDEGEDTFEH